MKLQYLFCLLLIIGIPLQAQEPVTIEPQGVTAVQPVNPVSQSNPAVSNTAPVNAPSQEAAPQMNTFAEPVTSSSEAPTSSHTVTTDLRIASTGPSTSLATLSTGEQIDVEVHFEDIAGPGSVFSGYADFNFDPNYLLVDSITYHSDFSYLQGISTAGSGIYEDLGATSSQTSAGSNTLILTVRMTVQQTGATTISLSQPSNVYAETTIYGNDNDQRASVNYTSASLTLGSPATMIDNGSFSSNTTGWNFNGDINYNVNNGILSFYNVPPFNSMARVFQEITQPLSTGTQMEVTLEVGNTSIGTKALEVVLRDSSPARTQFMVCAFSIPPNTPLTKIALRDTVTSDWTGATLLLRSTDFDNRAALTVDNVEVREYTGSTLNGLDCDGFNVPPNSQLLRNGNVDEFGLRFWNFRGDIEYGHTLVTSSSGYMNFHRISDPGNQQAAVVYQESQYHIEANMQLEAIVRLGNSSNQARDVRLVLRDRENREVWDCYFSIPANTDPLTATPVRVRGVTGEEWGALTMVLNDLTTLDLPTIEVDQMIVVHNPNATITNQCYSNFSTTGTTTGGPADITDTKAEPQVLPEIHSEQPAPPPESPADTGGSNQDMSDGMPTIPGF